MPFVFISAKSQYNALEVFIANWYCKMCFWYSITVFKFEIEVNVFVTTTYLLK